MNEKHTIDIELRLPDNINAMLSGIISQLEILTNSSNSAMDSFRNFGTVVTTLNNVNTAAGLLAESGEKASFVVDALAGGAGNLAEATQMLGVKSGILAAAKGILTNKITLTTAKTWLLTAAKTALGLALKALPFVAIAAGIATAVTAITGWIRRSREAREAAAAEEKALNQLSDQWGMSVDEIRAEMEKHGLSVEEWAEQRQLIQDVADQWNVCATEIKSALEEMTLDEWVAQQEEQLGKLSDKWGVSTDYIMAALEEQGISMEQWEAQQYEMLQGIAEEWGMCTSEILAQMQEQGISAEQWASQMGQAWDSFQADVARNVDGIVNGFRRIPEEYGQSAEDLRQIMEDNIATTQAWRDNMSQIASEVSPQMLAWLESKGPEFNSVVEEMLNCDAELAAWKDTFDRATELGMAQALDNIDDPAIRDAIVSRLDEAGQAAADSTALEDGHRTAIERANENGSALAREGGVAIGNAAIDGATSADYSQIPQAITSAISGGLGAAVAAAGSIAAGVQQRFEEMRQQCDTIARNMMTQMNTAITSETSAIHSAVETVKTGVVNIITPLPAEARTITQDTMTGMTQTISSQRGSVEGAFRPLQSSLPSIMTSAMNGAFQSLDAGGRRLIDRARAIADAVAREMARALRVNSPSRVMIDLFGNVMDGIYVGMDRGEDSVLKKAEAIADNLKDALTIKPDFIDNMVCKMQAIVDAGVISPRAAFDAVGSGRTITNTTHNSPRIELAVNYYGGGNAAEDTRAISKRLAQETAKALRGRGIAAVY